MNADLRPILVFDLGGVLIDWDPRRLYRKLFDDPDTMDHFLGTICTGAWNAQQDAGRPFAEGVALLTAQHPGHAEAIQAYHTRWIEMIGGAIEGTVALLETLHGAGYPCYALSNWSAETFPLVRDDFPFLGLFEDTVLSGEEGCIKPDREIYDILLKRVGAPAEACLFIDDSKPNIETARRLGLDAIHFTSSAALRTALRERGLPV